MTVVYVDSVFVLNALMDYLLVLCAARLAGIPLRRRRYLLAGLLGGAYAVAVFLPGLGFLSATPVKLAAGILLALAAYGGEAKLLRLTLLLFAVSCAMAGCVLALGLVAGGGVPMVNGVFYTDVDAKVLLTAAAAAYLVLTVVFRAAAGKGVRGELVRAQVCLAGRTTAFTAFCDTGNALRDPVSGAPVLVVSPLSFGRPRGKTAKPQKSAGHSDRRNQAATVRLFFCMPSFYLSHVNNVRPEKYDLQEKLMHITHRKPRDLFLCTAVSFVSRACYCSKKAFRQPLNAAGRQNL